MGKKELIIGLGQWLCVLVIGIGIGVELAKGAALGYILITSGAVLFATLTKLRG